MSDTKDTSKHGIGARTLSVKRPTVEQGRVRQNFSHGRSKTVAVEIKRKRTPGPAEGGKLETREPVAFKPAPPKPEPRREEPVSSVRPGMVLRTLTDDEKEARERALADARLREAEERKHAEEEAKRRSLTEEAERRDREAADTRKAEEEAQRRLFLLQIIQPGLVGLMDGSVSTLAPLFAAAFATHSTWETFLVGMAASIGAGISMGFAEALSDDGKLTGRCHPIIRGVAAGVMTAVGGLGHALPYLIPDFWTATILATMIVFVELGVISWIRYRFMDTPFMRAAFQVAVGGFLVFLAGIFIGNA